jgi:thiol:disulfide interchange protein DsbD
MFRFNKVVILCLLALIPLRAGANFDTFISTFSAESLSEFLGSGNLAVALLVALVAGFLTALSPCVYPVIPITLSVIGARRYDSAFQGFLVSLSYVGGMVALYVALGILFSSVGILFGSVYRHPAVLFAVAVLFLIFALSMLGFLNWVLPDSILKRLSRFGGSGIRGAFLMGLVSGLIASPCTGPVLGFILTLISRQGDFFSGSLLMVAYGVGMGIPFLILGTFSSAISRIPKSGTWMTVIKAVFAIGMLSASAYFFMLGVQAATSSAPAQNGDVLGQLESELATYKNEGMPVVIDFYADWCVQCGEIEKLTLKDPKVIEKMKKFRFIRVDLSGSSEALDKVQTKFQIDGLPLILFYDRAGKAVDDQRVTGFIDADAFLMKLDKVLAR